MPARGSGAAVHSSLLQHRGHGTPFGGNLPCGDTRRSCARSSRSGRVACLEEACCPRHHYTLAVAAEFTRVQPGLKYLSDRNIRLRVARLVVHVMRRVRVVSTGRRRASNWGPAMQQESSVFIGLDTSKMKIFVDFAEEGRQGEVRFFGDIEAA